MNNPMQWKKTTTSSMIFMMLFVLLASGCTQHTIKVEPIKIEPIYVHATIDVNVRVDKDLDKFFDFQSQPPAQTTAPGTQPAGGK